MATDTLFSFLVRRFREHEEVLATAGLGYVLEDSQACRASLRAIIARCGAAVSERIVYHTQVTGDDGGIPDLVGSEPGGPPEVIVEGKFWAGLTDHQPGTYLARLQPGQPGVLLFVTPSQRIDTLWPKVLERCPPTVRPDDRETIREDELRAVPLASGHILAMASWRFLLNDLSLAAKTAGQDRLVADIAQLHALCEAQDRQAFRPLRVEELTDQRIARRIVDYYSLPNAITKRGRRDGVVTTAGLAAARSEQRFGHYLQLRCWGAYLVIDPTLWASYGQGPLWLELSGYAVYDSDNKRTWRTVLDWAPALSRLKVLRATTAPGPVVIELPDGRPAIGLHLSTHVERDDVINGVLEQLRLISDILGDEAPLVSGGGATVEPAPPTGDVEDGDPPQA